MEMSKRAAQLRIGRDMFEDTEALPLPGDDNNPYQTKNEAWYWYDPREEAHGPYGSEEEAETDLCIYLLGLEHARDTIKEGLK